MSADKKPISETPVVPPSCPTGCSEQDWKTAALECLQALRLMNAHYDDISKSNPGFMGKLCLQRYDIWNEALLSSERTLRKYSHIPNPKLTLDAPSSGVRSEETP